MKSNVTATPPPELVIVDLDRVVGGIGPYTLPDLSAQNRAAICKYSSEAADAHQNMVDVLSGVVKNTNMDEDFRASYQASIAEHAGLAAKFAGTANSASCTKKS